jgi:Ca2+-binding EF-hand superfamily protein
MASDSSDIPTIQLPTASSSSSHPAPPQRQATADQLVDIVQNSNFDKDELERLRKRFMKLDKDNSGTIDREEFLNLPQISSNPLATRYVLSET